MTKEEYERLLNSDYWKGYSYSLIKERNFTCHDCGRSFPGERNKLQVHHLHYRDANPWSYDPSELVVLCEECHRKRHGILPSEQPVTKTPEYRQQVENSNYTRSFESSYSTSEKEARHESAPHTGSFFDVVGDLSNWKKPLLMGLLLLAFVTFAAILFQDMPSERTIESVVPETPIEEEVSAEPTNSKPVAPEKVTATPVNREPMEELEHLEELAPTNLYGLETNPQAIKLSVPVPDTEYVPEQAHEKTTLELLEERNHANTVKRAQDMGVSTEGTTLEIMEKINHANTVKRAQDMGVSTEGTTLEIMERINHANTVKRAKEVGVSTDGSTLEIMERINHANTVKRAQEVGVSAEGTTLEILERINRKQMEMR